MKISVTTIRLDLTPALRTYIEMRFAPLEKLIASFDAAGGAELRIEVSRTTRHHRHGEVFFAAANLRLPQATLRAESEAEDARAAVDAVKNTLAGEIRKYKTKFLAMRRRQEK